MLVLNTNQGGGGENVLSNANVMTNYPDIDNSILLFPDRRNRSSNTLATINGLTFAMLGGIISKNDLVNIKMPTVNYTACPPQLGFYMGSAGTQRITTIGTLSQLVGATIGKKIVLPDLIVHQGNISIKVGILHADGTITYFNNDSINYSSYAIGEMSIYNNRGNWASNSSDTLNQYGRTPQQRIIETNGIVVQEGDRVYAELTLINSGAAVSFGSYFPIKPEFSIKPIQFSID